MRKGMRGHAAILGTLLLSDKTANQIADAVDGIARTIRPTLRQMVNIGFIHVCGFDHSMKGTPQAIFRFGQGRNAEMPISKRRKKPCTNQWSKEYKPRIGSELIAFKSIWNEMSSGSTKTEIIEQTGVHWSTLAVLMREMKALNLIHICGWISSSDGYPAAVYMLGQGRDVRRPKPEDKRERSLRYYHARKEAQIAAQIRAAFVPSLEAA
jgi:hypothetical protein